MANDYKETISSVSAHDSYSCNKPKELKLDKCSTCTSRQPNIGCKYLKIETIYIKD